MEETGQGGGARPRSLRELRKAAALNQVEVIERVKRALPQARFSQPALSRAEKGTGRLASDVVRVLCEIYGITGAERAALIQQATDAEAGYVDARVVLQAGNTMNLMSATISGQRLEQLIQSRRDRQALLDTDRRFTLLHAEGALRWHIGSPTVMAAQLDHLAELTGHPKLRLGVIPWDRPLTMHARHAFHLYDTHTVIVGTESGTAFITDPVEVDAYDRRFTELEHVAAFGDQAARVFERVIDDYRTLGQPANHRRLNL